MVEANARDVLEKYAAVLRTATASVIRDIVKLPYPKDVIKTALKGALRKTYNPETRERLKIACLDLAEFQPLTDKERQAIAAMSELRGEAPRECKTLTEQVRTVGTHSSTYQAVVMRSHAEREALFFELTDLD